MGLGFRQFMEQGEAKVFADFGGNTAGVHNDFATAKFLSSTWTGSGDIDRLDHSLPATDLEIPNVSRRSKIRSVEKNKNPIKVQMMDGTELYLTLDEFKRIDSRTSLTPGREVTVTFQRRGDDGGREPSKIVSVS